MSSSQSKVERAKCDSRRGQALLTYFTLFVAGSQVTLAVHAWRHRDVDEGFLATAASPLVAALLLIVAIVSARVAWRILSRFMILALGAAALYYIGPGTTYFDTLVLANTPTAIEHATTIALISLYLFTPLMMLAYAVALARSLTVQSSSIDMKSSFVHRSLLDQEQEWKPEPRADTNERAKMPTGFGVALALLIFVGTGLAFLSLGPLHRKVDEAWWPGWFDLLSLPADLHFSIFHPAVMFVAMFAVIAALWRVATQRRMGRVLLGLAIGMQALLAVGLFV